VEKFVSRIELEGKEKSRLEGGKHGPKKKRREGYTRKGTVHDRISLDNYHFYG